MKLLSPRQVVARIAIIISLAEFLIMLVLGVLPHEASAYAEAMLDVFMLALLSTPLIYFWVIRPFVKARDEALSQINHLAHLDPLTQLANRRLILKHLQKCIAGNVRHNIYGALLLLDLDEFKQINDTHGHDVGDALLIELARRIQSITRAEDVVGRLGGDEFVVILNYLDTGETGAREKTALIAAKLIELMSKPFMLADKEMRVGVSIGVRLLEPEAINPEKAMSEADMTMYRAKQAGKGRVEFFEK